MDALDAKKVEEELLGQLELFVKQTKATVIPTTNVNVADVFDSYFAARPPFGQAKKKSEFPDAFAIAAVRDWCSKENEKMYVVSGDGDMRAVCDGGVLYGLEKLAEFLDLVASHNEALITFVKQQIHRCESQIVQEIKTQFTDRAFILEDHDGEVVDVEALEVALSEMEVLRASENEATLETEAEVTFNADLRYGDEGTASYDSEDRRAFFTDYVRETVQRTEYIPVEIEVSYKKRDPDSFEVNDISTPRNTVVVRSSRDERWPW
jgi:hypothetical protein